MLKFLLKKKESHQPMHGSGKPKKSKNKEAIKLSTGTMAY